MEYRFEKTWWISKGEILGGQYPGTPKPEEQKEMLIALLELGITFFISLQRPKETGRGTKPFPDYMPLVHELARARGVDVGFNRFPISDQAIPDTATMEAILDCIDEAIISGKKVYVHCWGGNGRTGTVAGCWLVRHGRTAEQAFREMAAGRKGRHFSHSAPENESQLAFVRKWSQHAPKLTAKNTKPELEELQAKFPAPKQSTPRNRAIAALLGLAVGDALGTTIEFTPPGSFRPVTDMVGGGPFDLAPGEWTDDTSMALCLAESIVECSGFDPRDQIERYCRWWKEGHFSVKGHCFDIGGTTRDALSKFMGEGKAYAGSTSTKAAGNGSLMRLAPVAMAFANRPTLAIGFAGESSRTTHAARECVDACRYLAAILVGLINGESKDAVLSDLYTPVANLWDAEPLAPKVVEIAAGSFKEKAPPTIRGTGYVIECLEAALWAFYNTGNFRDAILKAANLGNDADTTAAVCGQIAGACYGTAGLPGDWVGKLAMREEITQLATKLTKIWDS